jgi:hypothetical protein
LVRPSWCRVVGANGWHEGEAILGLHSRQPTTGHPVHRRDERHRQAGDGFADPSAAIQREKNLKHYVRDWKINLIERGNPQWIDLFPALPGAELFAP